MEPTQGLNRAAYFQDSLLNSLNKHNIINIIILLRTTRHVVDTYQGIISSLCLSVGKFFLSLDRFNPFLFRRKGFFPFSIHRIRHTHILTHLRPGPSDVTGLMGVMCTVMVIRYLGKTHIQTNRDIPDVLRHIIKNFSKGLFRNILSDPCHTIQELFFSQRKVFLEKREDMDGRHGTHEDTEDTTMLVQIEEVKGGLRTLPFVTNLKLSPVDVNKTRRLGFP